MIERLPQHIQRFCLEHGLLKRGQKVSIAISGGVDSMALALVLKKMNLNLRLSAQHVHHGTRLECDRELESVRSFCKSLNIDLKIHYLNLDLKSPNFEFLASQKRREALSEGLDSGELLALGHHVDDSFEWWLMRSLRSSDEKVLGIPARNGRIIRPFMGATKSQVRRYAKTFNINFNDDLSNEDTRFDRGYIRKLVCPVLSDRYPNYLKNYVSRQNALARNFGLHLIGREVPELRKREQNFTFIDGAPKSFFGQEEMLRNEVKRLSKSTRGNIREQLLKLTQLPSSAKHGPMTLSGGVWAYSSRRRLIICNQQGKATFEKAWRESFEVNKETELSLAQARELFAKCPWDFYPVHFEGINSFGRDLRSLKQGPLGRYWPKSGSWLLLDSLLQAWEHPRHRSKKLMLRFRGPCPSIDKSEKEFIFNSRNENPII